MGVRSVAIFALLFLAGCQELRLGVEAYHAGDFTRAIELLQPIIDQQSKMEPFVTLSIESEANLSQAVTSASRDWFQAWQAHSGSLIGLGELDSGCHFVKLALRPVTVHAVTPRGIQTHKFDPRDGDFWQAEVRALRAWELAVPCGQR